MSADPIQIPPFNWKRPDYAPINAARLERVRRLRAVIKDNPAAFAHVHAYYAAHPAEFIDSYGVTFDPRNPSKGLPATVPFLLMPRQRELVDWIDARLLAHEHAIVEKARDLGASWVAMAYAVTKCLFHRGITILVVSRTEETLDRSGDPGTLFAKARTFLQHLPAEFLNGWRIDKHSAHMRITFPGTGSAIVGAGGAQNYRGGRASLVIVDEAAFIPQPELLDAALSAVSDARVDISTPNGRGNPFAEKRFSNKLPVFTLAWHHDLRKDSQWLDRQRAVLDEVTLAREILLDYSGSVAFQLIPPAWVAAAVDAHLKLGIEPSGMRFAGFDVADTGIDLCAVAIRYGILLQHVESWSGKASDIHASTVRAFSICDQWKVTRLNYDSDGLGSGVRGDARVINEARNAAGQPQILDTPFRGSGAVINPDSQMVPGRLNKDFFANMKSMAWWSLRLRFQETYQAVVEKKPYTADNLISLSSKIPELTSLILELSQPSFSLNNAGKVLIDKAPDNTRSPNLADSLIIAYSPINRALETWLKLGAASPHPNRRI
jgi:hypothetical protein